MPRAFLHACAHQNLLTCSRTESSHPVLGKLEGAYLQKEKKGKANRHIKTGAIVATCPDLSGSIKEKLGKKLAGWKEKMLSKAGKEVLIKAVAQVIPTYTNDLFLNTLLSLSRFGKHDLEFLVGPKE